jgi:2-oxoisovalerate dehydrogenase E1 component
MTIASPTVARPPSLAAADLLRLYEQMVLLRRFELAAQVLNRGGRLPGFLHLYIGEEATAVGVCAHLRDADWITSTHRGHGHALAKGVDPRHLMAELFAKVSGCCGGRGGSMHLYDRDRGLFGTNGLVGGGIPSAVGAGISAKVRKTDGVAVAFFGDGAVNHGTFHESVNFATAQDAPVVFVCENNLYATATPLAMATRNTDVASKAAAYGLPGVAVDGNDVLAVYEAAQEAVGRARAGKGPTLIEARTYRTVGHHEGDPLYGTYRTKEEVEAWRQRDPIASFRRKLVETWQVAGVGQLDEIEARVERRVQDAIKFGETSAEPDPATVFEHVYAEPINPPMPDSTGDAATEEKGWLDAVRDGIAEEMRRDPHVVYLGEGIGERGGSFAHTKGLWAEFGAGRVIDTPIAELGFTGAAVGASATGCRAVADLMFADFLFEAASQIIHQGAKIRYTSNGRMSVPMVVRAGSGEVKNAGPHHSDSYHPMWAHVPGLIVVLPATPADAKGLMKTALRAGDPVIFLEPKSLFATKGPVPAGEDHLVPFGVANVVRAGTDLTVVTAGLLVHRCLEAAEALARGDGGSPGISCEVIDLRTIQPLDVETVVASLRKTHRLLVVDEGYAMCGVGAELAAAVMEHAFDELDAPVGRLHTEPVSYPFSPVLEWAVVVTAEKVVAAARATVAGTPPPARRARANAGRSAAVAAAAPEAARLRPAGSVVPPGTPAGRPVASGPSEPAATGDAEAAGVPLLVPHGDLTITEAKLLRWLKQPGDRVAPGEPVVEVETDKAVTEIESPAAGVLGKPLAREGDVVKFGARIGTIVP